MKVTLLPIDEQVMVITGASSGIGLVTAKYAASLGARVTLAARNEADLASAVSDIQRAGGRAGWPYASLQRAEHRGRRQQGGAVADRTHRAPLSDKAPHGPRRNWQRSLLFAVINRRTGSPALGMAEKPYRMHTSNAAPDCGLGVSEHRTGPFAHCNPLKHP